MVLSDDRCDLIEQLYVDPNVANAEYFGCPASPTTVPARTAQCIESPARAGVPRRRQRTTSMNNQTTTANPSECVIRSNNRTIYTAGRPPWYNCAGQQVEPFVIGKVSSLKKKKIVLKIVVVVGICGGSASGKTTVAQKIIESLDVPWVTLLSMDCFYRVCCPYALLSHVILTIFHRFSMRNSTTKPSSMSITSITLMPSIWICY